MGTFSKALGSFGAYAAVSEEVREYLINTCRSFIYSTALPTSIVEANIAAIDIVEKESFRREHLLLNADYMRNRLKHEGFLVKGESQIIPVIVHENEKAVKFSEALKKKGFWVIPVRPPTVPKGEARLRISLTYDHTREVIDQFVSDLAGLENRYE